MTAEASECLQRLEHIIEAVSIADWARFALINHALDGTVAKAITAHISWVAAGLLDLPDATTLLDGFRPLTGGEG